MKIILFLLFIEIAWISASEKDDLNRNGVWVPWNARKSGIPRNAVVGGYDDNGPIYVIRTDHYQDGDSYRGVIPGRYSPNHDYASIAYYNKEYRYKNFEVLTHTNYFWPNKDGQSNYFIPGGVDSAGGNIWICRARMGQNVIPGKLHIGKCWIAANGKEHKYSDWDTLKRIDNNL